MISGRSAEILTIFSWMAKLVLLQSGHLFKGRAAAAKYALAPPNQHEGRMGYTGTIGQPLGGGRLATAVIQRKPSSA